MRLAGAGGPVQGDEEEGGGGASEEADGDGEVRSQRLLSRRMKSAERVSAWAQGSARCLSEGLLSDRVNAVVILEGSMLASVWILKRGFGAWVSYECVVGVISGPAVAGQVRLRGGTPSPLDFGLE